MQQGQFEEAGDRLGVPARHAAPPYGPGVHAVPGSAQPVGPVWVLLSPVPGHRPSHPRFRLFRSATMRGPDRLRNTAPPRTGSEKGRFRP
ncbi:hypothetical protein RGQ21_37350 [Kitasatospora aureofaciens]|nr:hypothetical protein RGQ21_37350 [Kitasatospora aureofaciens]